jgi:hypothetical protein
MCGKSSYNVCSTTLTTFDELHFPRLKSSQLLISSPQLLLAVKQDVRNFCCATITLSWENYSTSSREAKKLFAKVNNFVEGEIKYEKYAQG